MTSRYSLRTASRVRASKREYASATGPPRKAASQATCASACTICVVRRCACTSSSPAPCSARASVFTAAEPEEHRAYLGAHTLVDDREDLGPPRTHAAPPQTDATRRPPGRQAAHHRRQRGLRVRHVHQAQPAEHDVEMPGRQTIVHFLRIGTHEAAERRALRGGGQHLLREIGADDLATTRCHSLPGCAGQNAGSARDVEHTLAGLQPRRTQYRCRGRRECFAPGLLVVWRGTVPAVALRPQLQSRVHLARPAGATQTPPAR